jgi:beta-hydroxylase
VYPQKTVTYFYLGLIIFLIIWIIVYLIRNPTLLLAPYNWWIEWRYPKTVFYNDGEKRNIFPSSKLLENNWEKIRKEMMNLPLDKHNIGTKYIKEKDSFWEGWNTIELINFGKINPNLDKCPILKEILLNDPNITTAFFSLLAPGKTISSHFGPFKGIIRYHLGLQVPPQKSGQCYISVNRETYTWKEGEGILFDETYKHFVVNDTEFPRAILFLDVKRPLGFFDTILNESILLLMKWSPYG